MSQTHSIFMGYFLGYQGLLKVPELFVSKPPQCKSSPIRNSEETSSVRDSAGVFSGIKKGYNENRKKKNMMILLIAKQVSFGVFPKRKITVS